MEQRSPPNCLCLCSKLKKSAVDAAEQLRGLSLQEDAPSRVHHLTKLQNLFGFSPTGLGPQELNGFREKLQQIPAGEG